MMKNHRLWCLLGAMLAAFPFFATAQQQLAWEAEKTTVTFTILNAGSEVVGSFGLVSGQFVTDLSGKKPILIVGTAKVKSIDTGIGLRDRHLQTAEFFQTNKHPELRMQLLSVDENAARFAVVMKGKTKVVEVPYQWQKEGAKGRFNCAFKVLRSDFGVGGKSRWMDDEVNVKIDLQLRQQP